MATYRQVHIKYWQDPFVEELEPLQRYFYLYLMTNSKTTQCGCYEISYKLIKYETGLNQNQVDNFIDLLEKNNKIKFNKETNEFLLINWLKHNSFASPKVKACINKELKNIKNQVFIDFINSIVNENISIDNLLIDYTKCIDTYTQKEKEEEKEEEKEYNNNNNKNIICVVDEIPYLEIIEYLNYKTESSYKHTTPKTKELIKNRFKEGFELKDFKKCIDNQTTLWLKDPKMNKYLRPETLFGNKFESYVNNKVGLSDMGLVSQTTEKNMTVLENWARKKEMEEQMK